MYYVGLIERLLKLLPDADVHIWSSLQGYLAMGSSTYWKSRDFDVFRRKGAKVHLDDPDILQPWAHLARADVYIMSISSFSFIPAVTKRLKTRHYG